MTYFNGTHHLLVGVTSFTLGLCGTEGVVDGFARVTHQMDWIKQNSDEYVRSCSGRSLEQFADTEPE